MVAAGPAHSLDLPVHPLAQHHSQDKLILLFHFTFPGSDIQFFQIDSPGHSLQKLRRDLFINPDQILLFMTVCAFHHGLNQISVIGQQ